MRQQRTDVQVVAGGGDVCSVYDSTSILPLSMEVKRDGGRKVEIPFYSMYTLESVSESAIHKSGMNPLQYRAEYQRFSLHRYPYHIAEVE